MKTEIPGTSIESHEGKKYLRTIHPADGVGEPINIDVYQVLEAFQVTCPATAHAIKKLLCPGQRFKGYTLSDLIGALAAVNRAIDLQRIRQLGWETKSWTLEVELTRDKENEGKVTFKQPGEEPVKAEYREYKVEQGKLPPELEQNLSEIKEAAELEKKDLAAEGAVRAMGLLGVAPEPHSITMKPIKEDDEDEQGAVNLLKDLGYLFPTEKIPIVSQFIKDLKERVEKKLEKRLEELESLLDIQEKPLL